jgi:hypothetical protein
VESASHTSARVRLKEDGLDDLLGLGSPALAHGWQAQLLGFSALASDRLTSGRRPDVKPLRSPSVGAHRAQLTEQGARLALHDQIPDNNLPYPWDALNQLDSPVAFLFARNDATQVDHTPNGLYADA